MRPTVMKIYISLLLAAFFCFVPLVQGAQTSIRSQEFVLKSYALEGNYKFESEKPYPVVHKDEAGYFIHVEAKHDIVLFLANPESKLPARLNGDELKFWEDFELDTDRAYLVFSPEQWFRVISESESKYKIEYVFAKTKMHLSVEKDGFESAKHIRDADGNLVDRRVKDAKQAICLINFQGGAAGSGFLLYQGDKLYCYTNQHVAMNLGKMVVSLIDGTKLEQGRLEIAEDSDLARIEILTERPGFDHIGRAKLSESVKVLGNSLGAGRITVLQGKVTGLSEKQVETSAKFVTGNSGSPILNEDNAVIGVATLLEFFPDHKSILKGTGFEDGRRVGMRLDREIEWLEVDMGYFVSRNRLVLQTMLFIEELPQAMILAVSDDFTQKLALKNIQDPSIRQWLSARASSLRAVMKKHKPSVDLGVANHGNAFYYSPQFAAVQNAYYKDALYESKKYWNALGRKITMKKRTLSSMKAYPDSSYMRKSIQHSIEMLEAAEMVIEMIRESHKEFSELQ